jgi:hypothetical protein
MNQSRTRTVLLALLLTGSHFVGCTRASKPVAAPGSIGQDGDSATDPDDVPITEADVAVPATLAGAVERIGGYRDQIRSAIEAGTPTKAHRSLDELDIVLKKLMPLVRESGIAKTEWQDINLAT